MFKKQNDPPMPTSFRIESETRPSKGTSVLGPTLTFRGGELSSDEDLIIEGTVEGKIAHQNHHLTAAAKQQAKDISDKLSEAAEDFDAVEHDLNVARNKNKLADGSETDRELKDIKTKAAAKTGRGKLDALTGGGTTTPPADKPQS